MKCSAPGPAASRNCVVGPGEKDLDSDRSFRASQQQRVWHGCSEARSTGVKVPPKAPVVKDAPAGGFYQEPLLIADLPADHKLVREEVFGPVLVIQSIRRRGAGASSWPTARFGLVAGIWTRDGARQLRMARKLQSGQVFINNYGAGGGVELPFGGVKHSGYGREKGFEALYGFTTKTVAIRHGLASGLICAHQRSEASAATSNQTMAERVIPLIDECVAALATQLARAHRGSGRPTGPAAARPAHQRDRPLQFPLQLLHAEGSVRQGLPVPAARVPADLRGDHPPGPPVRRARRRKIRLTGGEPLLRKNLEILIEQLAALRTVDGKPLDLTLTTNGSLLARKARR